MNHQHQYQLLIQKALLRPRENNVYYEKHHIVPKHMGGSDDKSNIVELTVEEHADAHRKLYEEHGHLQDKLAWKELLGLISTAEIVRTLQSEGMKGSKNPMYGKPAPNRGIKRPGVGGRKKGTKWSEEERLKKMNLRQSVDHQEKMKKVYSDPNRNKKISDAQKGRLGTSTGKKWYNNSIEEKYFIEGQQPIGWNCGRINKK
jgi:hypothetical protein